MCTENYLAESLYDDSISGVDDLFYQWDPSTATPIEEMCRPPEGLC